MAVHTTVIVGCGHPLVGEVAKRFAAQKTNVVLMGVDDERLLAIARTCPERIETLSLAHNAHSRLVHLRDAWGDTPLHSYIDLSPFCSPTESNATLALDSIAFLTSLKAGLRAGAARAAVVFRDVGDRKARNAALDSLLCRASIDLAPAKVLALRLRGYDSADQYRVWADKLMALTRPRLVSHPASMAPRAKSSLGWKPSAA